MESLGGFWHDLEEFSRVPAAIVGPYVDPLIAKVAGPDPDGVQPHHRMMMTLIFCTVHTATYTVWLIAFEIIERFGLFRQYKIQDGQKQRPDLIKNAMVKSLVNHLFLQWAFTYIVIGTIAAKTGALNNFNSHDMPSAATALIQLLLSLVIEDTAFYWGHRLLHQKFLYARIHKLHHQFTVNHVLAAEYAHPIESIFANILPTWAPFFVMKMHGTTFLLWIIIRMSEACDGHCGYALPFSPFSMLRNGSRHDYHHSHSGGPDGVGTSGIYGSQFEFWDWICGTDQPYYNYLNKQKSKKSE